MKIDVSYESAVGRRFAFKERYGFLGRGDRSNLKPALVQSVSNHALQERIVFNDQYRLLVCQRVPGALPRSLLEGRQPSVPLRSGNCRNQG
jgi:hypothetical protein